MMPEKKLHVENLKVGFPLAWRSVFRQNFQWTLVVMLITAVIAFVNSHADPLSAYLPIVFSFDDPLFGVFAGGCLILGLKIIHSLLLHVFISYRLDGDQLIISKGIVLRKTEVIFIEKIVDIYVRRNWVDAIFFLSNVGIAAPGLDNFVISGFSSAVAKKLQRHLVTIIENKGLEVSPSFSRNMHAIDARDTSQNIGDRDRAA